MADLIIRELGLQPYRETWERMRAFTDARTPNTPNELWLLEHPPVFTLGRRGGLENLLVPEAELRQKGIRVVPIVV